MPLVNVLENNLLKMLSKRDSVYTSDSTHDNLKKENFLTMYVTRLLSHYKKNPESLSLAPQGPNSGYLVIQDEEAETYSCFGLCKSRYLISLPFPQNKILTTQTPGVNIDYFQDIFFIPVLDQPLSRNRYYAIEPDMKFGKRKGEGFTCLKEEQVMCPECKTRKPRKTIEDLTTKPLDPQDIYQQFEIIRGTTYDGNIVFVANSVARDGFPPSFLTTKNWLLRKRRPKSFKLAEALGLDSALRASLPDINIPVSNKSSEAVKVGMWYCPFMFIKDGTLMYQMKNSMYYEMTLEQRWEHLFVCENDHTNNNAVMISAAFQTEVVLVAGREAVWDEKNVVDKAIWFKGIETGGDEVSVGLSVEVFQRIKWEEERVGYAGGEEKLVRVNRVEEFGGGDEGWKKFGCYVLVERFVLKRMDGSLVMTYDFKHAHQIKCIWE